PRAAIDLLVQRTEVNHPGWQRFREGLVPLLIDGRRIFATHTQAQNLPGRSIHPRGNLDFELFSVTVTNPFEQENLALFVGQAPILKTHQRHQFGIFVYTLSPSVQLSSPLEVTKKRPEVSKIVIVC